MRSISRFLGLNSDGSHEGRTWFGVDPRDRGIVSILSLVLGGTAALIAWSLLRDHGLAGVLLAWTVGLVVFSCSVSSGRTWARRKARR
jgi:hypothetical protein